MQRRPTETWAAVISRRKVAVKLFTIAGPVLTYGISAGVMYGIILVLLQSV